MGIIKTIYNPILNIDTLESGTKIITCDHTINNIIERIGESLI